MLFSLGTVELEVLDAASLVHFLRLHLRYYPNS